MHQPADHEESLDRFLKELDKAREIADPLKPEKIVARVHRQMGRDILVAACPRCTTVAGLDGEGKHLCRTCHLWLHYVREE